MVVKPDARLQHLADSIGVTRLARLTGLDRCGVEVVGAVRPRGHVLQVCQGKGLTLAQARRSALGEALELWAAEQPDVRTFRFGPAAPDSEWDALGLRIAWVPGVQLADRRGCLVPAQAVYCPPAGQCWLGPEVTTWRSNGLGAHPTSRRAAVEHAVLEVVERDALARVLPDGWTPHEALRRLVAAPLRAQALSARGFSCFLFDLTPPGTTLPVAGALLFDLEGGPVPLTAGYACRRSWPAAAEAAWLEAAQSRLTEIHGAREDVLVGQRVGGDELLRALQGVQTRSPRSRVEWRPLGEVIRAPLSVVQLRAEPFVVKAVSPGLLVSELL